MCFFGSSSLGFLDWSCFRLCFVIVYFDLSHFTTGLFRFLVIRGRGNQVINQHASVEWDTRIQECQHTKRHYRNNKEVTAFGIFTELFPCPAPPHPRLKARVLASESQGHRGSMSKLYLFFLKIKPQFPT